MFLSSYVHDYYNDDVSGAFAKGPTALGLGIYSMLLSLVVRVPISKIICVISEGLLFLFSHFFGLAPKKWCDRRSQLLNCLARSTVNYHTLSVTSFPSGQGLPEG